jgi:hypothetical protein
MYTRIVKAEAHLRGSDMLQKLHLTYRLGAMVLDPSSLLSCCCFLLLVPLAAAPAAVVAVVLAVVLLLSALAVDRCRARISLASSARPTSNKARACQSCSVRSVCRVKTKQCKI